MNSKLNVSAFYERIGQAVQWFQGCAPSSVTVIHHNDADGLSSGACLARACDRQGLVVRRISLEKPFPEVLHLVLDEPASETVTIITDFGSGMLTQIADLCPKDHRILILDHHAILGECSRSMFLVNCRAFGISGDLECSAATTCALFARGLAPHNEDLLWLGVVGAAGDHQIGAQGQASGVCSEVLSAAIKSGALMRHPESGALTVQWERTHYPLSSLVSDLNSLGAYGYFEGGTDVAVKGLLEGFDERYRHLSSTFRERFEGEFAAFLSGAQAVNHRHGISWFILPRSFERYGMKAVGLACEQLLSEDSLPPGNYLLGAQYVRTELPGFGPILKPMMKVSMRVSAALRDKILGGSMIGVDALLRRATASVGGFIDACHATAAATTIDPHSFDQFLKNVVELLPPPSGAH